MNIKEHELTCSLKKIAKRFPFFMFKVATLDTVHTSPENIYRMSLLLQLIHNDKGQLFIIFFIF